MTDEALSLETALGQSVPLSDMLGFDIGRPVTGEQVKAAAKAHLVTHIPHHKCCYCDRFVRYKIYAENLYFSATCDCKYVADQPRPWDDLAEWINREDLDEKQRIMLHIGLLPN
ncbi:hypothetical protein [Methyloglobulus sp.]|uniref:hypothetical protein n=1 Tax=Methyloglobulus sp. TaxID=2518622 RepID=UPI0032B7DD57